MGVRGAGVVGGGGPVLSYGLALPWQRRPLLRASGSASTCFETESSNLFRGFEKENGTPGGNAAVYMRILACVQCERSLEIVLNLTHGRDLPGKGSVPLVSGARAADLMFVGRYVCRSARWQRSCSACSYNNL